MTNQAIEPGDVLLGKYRVVREIGRGGMAVVYLAHDKPSHDRLVAVKVLPPELTTTDRAQRFANEIRTAARLSHPHILGVIDSGEHGSSLLYVSPFIRGESLRERIRRVGALPLDEALRIGQRMAGALAHAHAQGVIHRDVKPGNILLDPEDNPYLADFGIAKALEGRAGDPSTTQGSALGTPQYMAPEQLAGDDAVGAAADVYSLGCVLYEMIAGKAPFATPFARFSQAAPPLGELRADVPVAVDEAIAAALELDAETRLASAAELEHILEENRLASKRSTAGRNTARRQSPQKPWVAWAGLTTIAILMFVGGLWYVELRRTPPRLNPMRIVVSPFASDAQSDMGDRLALRLQDAFAKWEDLDVVGAMQVREEISRLEVTATSTSGALTVAEALGAGRLLTGSLAQLGDSLRVELTLLDVSASGEALERETMILAIGATPSASALDRTAQHLLFGRGGFVPDSIYGKNPRSFRAQTAFVSGMSARDTWDLATAKASFLEALESDPELAVARLWRAQILNWENAPAGAWAIEARRVNQATTGLPRRERFLAEALVAMAEDRYPNACVTYRALLVVDPNDFAGRFGLGACQARDPVVIPDERSPSGWRFRGSGHAATAEFRQALEGLPSSHYAFGAGAFELVKSVLYTRENQLRPGRTGGDDPLPMYGFHVWEGDTLAIIPVSADEVATFALDAVAVRAALINQREILLDVARTWVTAFPTSADAIYALGLAQELVGDPQALQTYRRGREVAAHPDLWRVLAAAEVALEVRKALPDDLDALVHAVAIADSTLDRSGAASPSVAARIAPIAALLGRPERAAELSLLGAGETDDPVVRSGLRLLAYVASWADTSRINEAELDLETAIVQSRPTSEVQEARRRNVEQPAFMAYPRHIMDYLLEDGAQGPEANAIGALLRGDSTEARELLGEERRTTGWDTVLARANVLVGLGLEHEAAIMLSSRFATLGAEDQEHTAGVARLGSVAQSALLLADLRAQLGEAAASARWRRAVALLWNRDAASLAPPRSSADREPSAR